MIMDPYKVLGIPSSASDDEVKKAYRQMSRRYHPDANLNNPNKDQAEEKFKEVQQAYDQIMKERTGGYTSGYGGQSSQGYGQGQGFGGYGGGFGQRQYESGEPIEYQAAANYINAGHFQEALNVLNNISGRNAKWYYLSALANAGIGNNLNAKDFASRAAALEPNNFQYQQLKRQLESGGQWYQTMGSGYGGMPQNFDTSCCTQLCCMNMLCGCCCRPC